MKNHVRYTPTFLFVNCYLRPILLIQSKLSARVAVTFRALISEHSSTCQGLPISLPWRPEMRTKLVLKSRRYGHNLERCTFNNHTIKVWVICSWQSLGTSVAIALHLAISLFLCSSAESYKQARLRALEGNRVSSKRPSRVQWFPPSYPQWFTACILPVSKHKETVSF